MNSEENEFVSCPYCWEQIEIAVERIPGNQEYTEDCHVCCRPILFHIDIGESGDCCISTTMDE
ncbi:MAG: CPXCG motif-containing cysteine-rich protein [Lentisphaeraceae bacterium]|nr:CPXCG motif-containing cysteine-rich protein [Lentisphaeraceae bacterium]